MSDYINRKAIDDAAEGFWAKHKWCIIGGGGILLVGFVLGVMV